MLLRPLVSSLIIAAILAVLAAMLIPVWIGGSNCGGNSEALSDVKTIACQAIMEAERRADKTFSFGSATAEEAGHLKYFAVRSRERMGRYLLTRKPIRMTDDTSPYLVSVCDRAFKNVPRTWILSNPPTHAAAYSDGKTGLISTAEFAALDLRDFVPLDELDVPSDLVVSP